MSGLWVDDCILKLKRTPAEKLLLARICYRAGITKDGVCRDSNKELSLAIGIHAQSVSDLVQKLEKDGLLQATVNDKKANARAISPISQILTPYKENADRYKEITDSDYKEITDSAPESAPGLSGNSLDPISKILTPYKQIPDSLYKDRKPLKPLGKLTTSSATVSAGATKKNGGGFSAEDIAEFQQTLPAEERPPTPPVAPTPSSPKKQYGDGTLQQLAQQYFRDHPEEFPKEMYPEFLDHWTEIVQNSEYERDIGKELWRTRPTWNMGKKLSNWHTGYQRDQLKRNESATRQTQPAINGTHPASGPRTPKATGAGTTKRTPVVTADKLRRNGPANGHRDPNSGRGATVIDVERGDYSVEDSV